jgi:hypothetical protein
MSFAGGVVVAASVFMFGAQARAGSFTDLSVTPIENSFTCTPEIMKCFDVSSDKNITHIFVEFNACTEMPMTDSFSITVDGTPITKIHMNGGPCNHGPDAPDVIIEDDEKLGFPGPSLIDKPRFWFPLPGNQMTATVCVTTDDPTKLEVGAKSADDCAEAPADLCSCSY